MFILTKNERKLLQKYTIINMKQILSRPSLVRFLLAGIYNNFLLFQMHLASGMPSEGFFAGE